MGQAQRDLPGLALGLFLLQCVDQLDGGEEPHAQAVLAHGLDADGRSQVRLAGAWPTDQHHVLGGLDEVAFVEALDGAPEPGPKLRALMRRVPAWRS